MNGYYTWARLGYDGKIPHEVQSVLPDDYASARSVQELMARPGGAQWWRERGTSWQGTFDLTPGSRSHQILDAYLKEKGASA
jgi:hypothetical protein